MADATHHIALAQSHLAQAEERHTDLTTGVLAPAVEPHVRRAVITHTRLATAHSLTALALQQASNVVIVEKR
jgi:predicted secreted protein